MGEKYYPRGIGNNFLACYICGRGKGTCQPDMAAFVESKSAGEKVVAMYQQLDLHALLDYRDFEPEHVQVKVGACSDHLPNLEKLYSLTNEIDAITPEIIRQSLTLDG